MKKTRKILVSALGMLLCFSCFMAVACAKDKTSISVPAGERIAEVGSLYELPAPKITDADGNDVSATADYIVTAYEPSGDYAYINEAEAVKKLEVVSVGNYRVVYELLMEDDQSAATCEFNITAQDTIAPAIKEMLNFSPDYFLNEKITLPTIISEDASGVDISKTKIKVYSKKDNKEVEPDETDSFIATDIEGYRLKITLVDKIGLSSEFVYDINITEKWVDGTHLKGNELATFAEDRYLNNVKRCNVRDMQYALTDKVPAANADNNVGSSDGKALKVTLPEGAKKERRWLRIWFPQPVDRNSFGTLKLKLWINDCIDEIWWHNVDVDQANAISSWSSGSSYVTNDMVPGRWSVVEVPEIKFSEELYTDNIEYIDFAFWVKNNDVTPEIYIDEIFFDDIETKFVDTETENQDVIADFNEIGDSDSKGNPTVIGYENTIKYRGNVDRINVTPMGTRRNIFDYVDRGLAELGGNGELTGDLALKIIPRMSGANQLDSNFFFMFPKALEYNENYFIEMDLYIPNAEYSVLIRSFSEDKPYIQVKTAYEGATEVPLKVKQWNKIRIQMKEFYADFDKYGNGGMFIQTHDVFASKNKTELSPCYIDNIVISEYMLKPVYETLVDFTTDITSGANPLVTFTAPEGKEDVVEGTWKSPEDCVKYGYPATEGTGVYAIETTEANATQATVEIDFGKSISMDEFKAINLRFYTNKAFSFGLMRLMDSEGHVSDNAGDVNSPGGYIWKETGSGWYIFSMPNGGKLAYNNGTENVAFKDVRKAVFQINAPKGATITVIDYINYTSMNSLIVARG